jgi:hypothetical protein
VKCTCLKTHPGGELHREIFTVDKPDLASVAALFAAALTDGEHAGRIAEAALDATHNDLALFEQWLQLISESDEGPLNPQIVTSVIRRIGARARVAAEISRRIAAVQRGDES